MPPDIAMGAFRGAERVAGYAESTARRVPGLADLHRMAALLLAERMPADGRLLVLGAGGGMELAAFAAREPGWHFDGVDPSPDMLALARRAVADFAARIRLTEGTIDDASAGPFDGATCLLTLHFLPEAERLATLAAIHRRLRPGAPLVVAHHSVGGGPDERTRWLARTAMFSGEEGAQARTSAAAMQARLPLLSPDRDEAVLQQAGFTEVRLFFAALSFRGWVGYRG